MASVTTHQPQSHDVLHCFSPLSDDDPQRRGLRRISPKIGILVGKRAKISKVKDAISIANNACWSIGELVVKVC
ncbi:hypothetical protein Ahy_B08g091802 isoform B [Arachis hypogaea]|uniref:Uncharacterized protein n=1 Tax=Arachis hypogaea TaxID=3818 RepID=A0A444Y2M0_ARAHY|nr:hypothetical protein Ahy_B08g091802 isoform B [Arachis hypogaea]